MDGKDRPPGAGGQGGDERGLLRPKGVRRCSSRVPLQRGQIQGRASQGHWWAPPRCSIGSSQRRKQRSRKRCLEDRQQRIQNGPVRLQDSEGSQGRQGQG